MTWGQDERLPTTADAALDKLLGQWAESRALTASQAETIYHSILSANQELSGEWFLDLVRQINFTLSRVTRPPASHVASDNLATAERSLAGHRDEPPSLSRMATFRPYLRWTPDQPVT